MKVNSLVEPGLVWEQRGQRSILLYYQSLTKSIGRNQVNHDTSLVLYSVFISTVLGNTHSPCRFLSIIYPFKGFYKSDIGYVLVIVLIFNGILTTISRPSYSLFSVHPGPSTHFRSSGAISCPPIQPSNRGT